MRISANDFWERLYSENLNNKEIVVVEEIVFNSDTVDFEFIQIVKVTFQEFVRFSEVIIPSGIAFIGCTFKKGAIFRGLDSRQFNTSLNSFNASILFSNCEALQISMLDKCMLDRGILMEDKCQIGLIRIHRTVIKNHGLNIRDCNISRVLDISEVKSEIKIAKTTIGRSFRVANLEGDISLNNSNFKGDVQFWACYCKNGLVLNHNEFEDNYKIEGSRINSISIIGGTFHKSANIENRDTSGNNLESYIKRLHISEAKIMETLEIDGLGKEIEVIRLPITSIFKGVLRITNWRVKELRLSGINENLKLLISQCEIQRLIAIDFTNYADLNFDRCKGSPDIYAVDNEPDCSMILAHTNFGPTKFNEYDFNSFFVIKVDNVSFDGIIASNVIWFEDDKLIIGNNESRNEISFRRRREVYRQIKQSLRKTGNNIDSLIFQSRELKTLRDEKKASSFYSLGDRLIMLTNMTNNYGTNWLKPFCILVVTTLCFYFLILPLLSDKITYYPSFLPYNIISTLTESWDYKSVFFQLFNPARRFEIVYGNLSNDWLILWDSLHRLILGVLIFQIIRAFRKYFLK